MKTLVCAGVVLVLSAGFGSADPLCVRKNGRLVQRPACRAGEHAFDPHALGVTGPTGPDGAAGPTGDPGRFPLRIVDVAGREVGEIEALHPDFAVVQVRRAPLDRPTLFVVTHDGYHHDTFTAAYYTSPDCAGTPYVEATTTPVARARVFGTAAYVPNGPADEQVLIGSAEYDPRAEPCSASSTATTRSTCCENNVKQLDLQPTVRIPLADLGVTPPFRAVRR